MWSEFPQTLTQIQGVRRYVTLFKSPFVDSSLSEKENNALRASSLLAVPPPPPEVQPLEGLQGTNLPKANLTQWAFYVQDVASGMWRPPHAATDCPNQDIVRVLLRLENLTEFGFCHLCYALGSNCGCSRATYQAPHSYGSLALWVPPKPSYASMALSTVTTTSTSMRGVSPTVGPPPGFPAMGAPTQMDVLLASQSYNPLAHAGVGRGLWPQSAPGSMRPQAPGGAGGLMTSGSSGESSWMEGRPGDGSSWFDQVTHAEAGPGACKRKKTNAEQQAPGRPFPLISEDARRKVMGIIYEHTMGQEPSQKNIASRAISAYYPDFTPAAVKGVASQVLCMIAKYHLACATMGSMTMSHILPEAVEQYLPLLVDYTRQVAQASLMCKAVTTSPTACM